MFKRDWDQTKHDFGGDEPDTDQYVDDTVKLAAGKQPIPSRGKPTYEAIEVAYRFGYGAHFQYERHYPTWNNQLESQLETDWVETYNDRQWRDYRDSVRRGWDYEDRRRLNKAAGQKPIFASACAD